MQLYVIVATEAKLLRWLRRWRERGDRRLVKPAAQSPDIDPLAELCRILGEPRASDFGAGDVHCVDEPGEQGRSLRVQQSALRKLFRPRRSLPIVRDRTPPPGSDLPQR
jgi:hypothetical protein